MIAVTCQHCSARYKLSDQLYDMKGVGFGVIVTCRHCKAEIFVRRPGEASVPPVAGTGTAAVIPRPPRALEPDSVPPPALPLTRRKRAANLGPPTNAGADLPEVVVDLSDLEAAEADDLEAERTPPRSRSPLPVAPTSAVEDMPPARGRGVLFAVLALLGAAAAGVFGFMLRGAMPVNTPSAPRLDEKPLPALEPPGATTPEPGDVPVDDGAEDDEPVAHRLARPNAASKKTAENAAKPEESRATEAETADADAGTETETAEESAPAEPAGPFDRDAASAALGRAAGEASACRRDGDPSGMAAVTITYSPSGRVTTATIAGPPFSGTPTGGCIAATFRKAAIPPFSGELVTVKKTVTIH